MPEDSLGDWLHRLERIHPEEIDLGLGRTLAVARHLGLLPFVPKVLTVAGTNGKGSVVYASEALLRAHGWRTGRYTSPHLFHFNERIALDGQPVSDGQIVAAFEAIEAARGATTLTYFEFATLAALWIFREAAVDVAILEVGLGGRLDAVNIVDCDVAVITAIALDHQKWLGDTVEAIAPEKAAVARPGRPVVLAEKSYPATLHSTLKSLDAVALRAGEAWSWRVEGEELLLRVEGQAPMTFRVPEALRPGNVAAALRAVLCLLGADLDIDRARAALAALTVPGRRQRIPFEGREWVFDVAHNPAAMASLATFLEAAPPPGRTTVAVGVMDDKDIASMAASLARVADGALALAIPGIARAAAPERVWEALDEAGIATAQEVFDAPSVFAILRERSSPGDRLVVCGSFHTVAGIMSLLPADPCG